MHVVEPLQHTPEFILNGLHCNIAKIEPVKLLQCTPEFFLTCLL